MADPLSAPVPASPATLQYAGPIPGLGPRRPGVVTLITVLSLASSALMLTCSVLVVVGVVFEAIHPPPANMDDITMSTLAAWLVVWVGPTWYGVFTLVMSVIALPALLLVGSIACLRMAGFGRRAMNWWGWGTIIGSAIDFLWVPHIPLYFVVVDVYAILTLIVFNLPHVRAAYGEGSGGGRLLGGQLKDPHPNPPPEYQGRG